jgi:hypothetical protein
MLNVLIFSQPSSSFVGCPAEPAKIIVFRVGCFSDPVAVGTASIYCNKNVGLSRINSPYRRPMFSVENPVLVVSRCLGLTIQERSLEKYIF